VADLNVAVFGIYPDRPTTSTAMVALRTAGFTNEDLDALFPDEVGTSETASSARPKPVRAAVLAGVFDAIALISLGSFAARRSGFKRSAPNNRAGRVLLVVRCDDSERAEKAKNTGAVDVSISDRAAFEFGRKNRILVRATSDRAAVTPLRLVEQPKRNAHHSA
jgi:hypothetical protein